LKSFKDLVKGVAQCRFLAEQVPDQPSRERLHGLLDELESLIADMAANPSVMPFAPRCPSRTLIH